jgi:hypothetical protein
LEELAAPSLRLDEYHGSVVEEAMTVEVVSVSEYL